MAMAEASPVRRMSTARLILIPSVIALAITILRLVGELQHWSPAWFNTEGGGITPTGVSWVIGITWLPLLFGVYFALKLRAAGQAPANPTKAVILAVLGVAIFAAGMFYVVPSLGENTDIKQRLLVIWASSVGPAIIQLPAWPQLWKALLAYGLASRIPVAAIMFFAFRGNWGTHYDYTGQIPQESMMEFYLWFALIPQLVFWVAFTILFGALTGSVTALAAGRGERPAGALGTAG